MESKRIAIVTPYLARFIEYCHEHKIENATFVFDLLKLRGVQWDKVIILEELLRPMLHELYVLRNMGRVKEIVDVRPKQN